MSQLTQVLKKCQGDHVLSGPASIVGICRMSKSSMVGDLVFSISKLALKAALCVSMAVVGTGLAGAAAYADDNPRYQEPSQVETGPNSSRPLSTLSLPSQKCTSLSNGGLCITIRQGSSGSSYKNINVTYEKTSGSQIHSYMGWNSGGTEVVGGYFYLTAGNYESDSWNNNYLPGCPSVYGFLYTDGQGRFQTPSAASC
ncbi:hypothetical protein [Nonomuraea sp. NPDC049646]|uniref:hypothetical protein n=1 Tax=unclassified Nonomuraea TaxID=2593643 RepID=UPI0037BA4491